MITYIRMYIKKKEKIMLKKEIKTQYVKQYNKYN